MTELANLSVVEAGKKLVAGECSAIELTRTYLDEIGQRDAEICAYREVYDDALEQARLADERRAAGENGFLLGIPMAFKDVLLDRGREATAGSKILQGYNAVYDSTVVGLLKKEGVIFLGRTNQDEFAMGSSGENSAYAIAKNPRDLSRVPGGSSSGSAAAVAGHLATAALGTDTGGSIRQPAAFCGLVGLKPTYGTVSRYGQIALASSFDQIGPLTRTVVDTELIFRAIARYDCRDSTNIPIEKRKHAPLPGKGKKLGVPRALMEKGLEPAAAKNFEDTLVRLCVQGYEIIDVELPNLHFSLPVYYIIQPAEASTNLARFDGMRYGLSGEEKNLLEVYEKNRGEGFGKEVRRRILLGAYVLSAGYYNAYYNKACAVRELLRSDFKRVFREVDAVVTPTTPGPAFKIGEKTDDPLAMYLCDIFTVTANVVGVPAISVPSGTVSVEGKELPLGFQVMGPWFGEDLLFQIGRAVTGEL